MKAWTVRQPLASLIVMGAAPYMVASEPVPAKLIEERVAVYSHPDRMAPFEVILLYENVFFEDSVFSGIDRDKAGDLLTRIRADIERDAAISRVPLGVILGTVKISRSRPLTELFPDDPEIPTNGHAWMLSEPEEFPRPRLARPPFAEFWEWDEPEKPRGLDPAFVAKWKEIHP